MKTLFLLLMCCHASSTVKHSLKVFQTASYGVSDFPEYVASAMIDEVGAAYCDHRTNTVVLHEWISELEKDDPEQAAWLSFQCSGNLRFLKATMDEIMTNLNQSGGSHFSQWIGGCEWDDETNETAGFLKTGYDGEDFIEVDLQTVTLIALKPEALPLKLIWETDIARFQNMKAIFLGQCPDWLKKYLLYGNGFLLRPELPSVSLLQKSPSSPVSCFATGFYPNRAAVFWRKDGEELHEDVDYGDILPNHNYTFQMSVNLSISAVNPEDWGRYECVFQLHGVKEDIITKLDKKVIRTNYKPPSGPPVALVSGLVVGLLLLLVCIAGIVIWRRKTNRFQRVAGTCYI